MTEEVGLNQRQLAVDHQQHAVEFLAAAQDQAGRRDHAVHALLARELRIFLDAIERDFGGAAEYRKHRAVLQEIDGVIAPFAVGDHAPVEVQDAIEFQAVEGNSMWHWARSGGARRCAALAWIGILQNRTHAAPSCHLAYMIAPTDRRRKGPLQIAAGRGGLAEISGKVTGSLAESYCCPTSANRPPLCVAKRNHCVGPVLSVPDSSAPSPPGPSGSGLSQGSKIPSDWANESWSFFFLGMPHAASTGRTRPALALRQKF